MIQVFAFCRNNKSNHLFAGEIEFVDHPRGRVGDIYFALTVGCNSVRLEKLLAELTISAGKIPVIHNVDVAAHEESDEIRTALAMQLWQPVRWSATIQSLVKMGAERFAECGPGKVLAGLNRRISRDIKTVALVDYASLVETAESWS